MLQLCQRMSLHGLCSQVFHLTVSQPPPNYGYYNWWDFNECCYAKCFSEQYQQCKMKNPACVVLGCDYCKTYYSAPICPVQVGEATQVPRPEPSRLPHGSEGFHLKPQLSLFLISVNQQQLPLSRASAECILPLTVFLLQNENCFSRFFSLRTMPRR